MRLSHAEAQALVSARLDGPLDPVAERELNAHLATCDSCRAFNVSATQLARGLQGLPRMAPSPAVTRAVLEHVSTPRSGLVSLFGGLPQNALPIASAVAAAVIVLFIGAFGVMRWMDDDEPNVIPALTDPTSETNLAQQPQATEGETVTVEVESTDAPPDSATEAPAEAATEPDEAASTEGPADSATEDVAGQTVLATEPASEEPATETQPVDPETEATEATEAAGETSVPEGDEPTSESAGTGPATESDDGSSQRVGIVGTESTPEGEPAVTDEPTEPTGEPVVEPTQEPEVEPTAEDGISSPDDVIDPSGASVSRTEEPTATIEPTATVEPTAESTPEPTATTEPTPEPTATAEPTLEPTATAEPTLEPTATTEPTPEPTATTEPTPEPTQEPTSEPTPEVTPTQVPIIQRDETPTGDEPDVTPETDDGTGAAITEEPDDDQPIEPSGQTEGQESPPDAAPTIEPANGEAIIGPPGDEGDGTDSQPTPAGASEATAEAVEQPQDGESNTGVGSASLSLGTAPEVQDLASVPGDQGASGARLGLDADGQLSYGTNPGRVSLARNGITLQGIDAELGQAVGACDANGACVDVSTASKGDEFTTDTPIGWIGDTAVYERLLSDDSVEFRAVSVDPSTGSPVDDVSLGEGPWDWFTIVRPYPLNGGLLVPTLNYWLFISADGVTEITDNPAQQAVVQIRLKPDLGLIAYSDGGSIYVAPLDAPGETIAQVPYDGVDYDLSPDGSQVAILTGDGIGIYDLNGNLVTTIPNPEGISVGSLTWLNDGIFFSDLTNGVLRVVQP